MMNESSVVALFHLLDEMTLIIQKNKDTPYLDSLADTLEILFEGEVQQNYETDVVTKLESILRQSDLEMYTTEQVRKAIQLCILNGMKESTQANHLMTPDTIALFMSYLVQKLTVNLESVRIFDPVSGTGNLLLTIMGELQQRTEAYAGEIDPTLIKLAFLSANLQQQEVEFFHQDTLRPLLLDPVDVVVADLPVGYYPDDIQASTYELKPEEGHAYAHHLFIEQSLKYTKKGGYVLLVIPEFLFESNQSQELQRFLQKHAHIIGLLQIAKSTFANKEHRKSIFILRKKGKNTEDVKQPLLVALPSFNDTQSMENILVQMNEWFEKNKAILISSYEK